MQRLVGRLRKKVRDKVTEKVVHLNRYSHFTELMRDPAIEGELERFQSHLDGTLQTLLTLRPAGRPAEMLFFFFHGMDGDAGDGVVVREVVKDFRARVVCLGGRGPSWVSDAFLSDAEQMIRTVSGGESGYYLAGISMGATQAIALAALLPPELLGPLQGVLAVMPGADLPAIAQSSAHARVRETLKASVAGDPAKLLERSPHRLLDRYPKNVPFSIYYNAQDTLLLTSPLEAFLAGLRARGIRVASFRAPGGHTLTGRTFNYRKMILALETSGEKVGAL